LGAEVKNFKSRKLRRGFYMADKVITCKDCSREFVFNESEQAFYKEKGFRNDPQRCPECRAAKKQQRNNSGYGSSYNRGGSRSYSAGGRW
jgi:hypothetical protein